ncbi:MAG TPA: stage II sporulation protein D [Ruminococcus flavefaciens]|nr:stage II sporulation protein D [Ruminococcus flavefaciens]HQM01186.1 stage II sporulation protein D [Ruminococcus flavefaciens]
MKKYIAAVLFIAAFIVIVPALPVMTFRSGTDSAFPKLKEFRFEDDDNVEPYKVLDVSTGEIMEVPVREYVIGAVCAEMPASFHSEAIKAQAVAAHTYAERQRLHEKEYPTAELNGADFSNDVSKYQGYYTEAQARQVFGADFEKSYSRISECVDEVLDYTIVYKDEPIISAFHSMSSGVTESAENAWGTAVDYLIPVDSGYDVHAPMYTNEVRYSKEVMQYKLESAFPGVELGENMVGWLVVRDVSEQGTVLKADVGNMSVTGGEVRTALALRSACFEVKYEGEEAVITTKGFGHGVGMSQYGANSMAAEGRSWREILKHYYTGCSVK